MFKSLLRDKNLLILLFLAICVKIFSLNENRVEQYYSDGLYPVISKVLRASLGWISFSVGDLLYVLAFIYFVAKVWKLLKLLSKRQVKEYLSWILLRKYIKLILWVYLLFNILWGLNYNRIGIARQLNLNVQPYTVEELKQLTSLLQTRMNNTVSMDAAERKRFEDPEYLFEQSVQSYKEAQEQFPFLKYSYPSIKPSLFTSIGHLFGFTGYYNPFTGEAQIKTTAPVFLKPFVVNHEMAHQIGYGKENEANLVSFLTGKQSSNAELRYSVYFETYLYAIRDLRRKDSLAAEEMIKQWHPQVKKDYEAFVDYLEKNRNAVEPYVTGFYDQYLKMNSQPAGKMTYSEVVAWMIAYMKKYGQQAI